jgi:hypothetical protein
MDGRCAHRAGGGQQRRIAWGRGYDSAAGEDCPVARRVHRGVVGGVGEQPPREVLPAHHPQMLARVLAGVKNVDTVIGGHIPVATWNDFKE